MTLETKHNPGDRVWLILDDGVACKTVRGMSLWVNGLAADGYAKPIAAPVMYRLTGTSKEFPEARLFRTKEELLASL